MNKTKLKESWDSIYVIAQEFVQVCKSKRVTRKIADKIIDKAWGDSSAEGNLCESNMTSKIPEDDWDINFDFCDDEFILDYWSKDSDDWYIEVGIDRYAVDIETEYYRGDYDSSEAGGLAPGYYGEGYSIENVDVPEKFIDVSFYSTGNDEELTLDQFKEISKLSEEDIDKIVNDIKIKLIVNIEDYVYDNVEKFID